MDIRGLLGRAALLAALLVSFGFGRKGMHVGDVGMTVSQNEDSLSDRMARDKMSAMTLEEKLGQLFMVAAYTNKGSDHTAHIERLIKDYHIGGLIFFKGHPTDHVKYVNRYQKMSKHPLFIAIDGEWGPAMRLDSVPRFPYQLTLGSITDSTIVRKMGQEIARQCKRLGIHINFAPVVDVNSNPNNPVINYRSFGENPHRVAMLGEAYALGMQDSGVLANAKHFPGHGDTDADSHKSLPVLQHDRKRFDTVDLIPFRRLINSGVASIMVAHLFVPNLDATPNRATTLSPFVVDTLLKQQLGFKGLIFTDALNMKGVSAYYEPGVVDIMAFKAGNDVLLYAEDVPRAVGMFKQAIERGEITEAQVNERVLKILSAKIRAGLYEGTEVDETNVVQDIDTRECQALMNELFAQSMTLLRNEDTMLPLSMTGRYAYVSIGGQANDAFAKRLRKYVDLDTYVLEKEHSTAAWEESLYGYDGVIFGYHGMSHRRARRYGVYSSSLDLAYRVGKRKKTAMVIFGSPYSLEYFGDLSVHQAVLLAHRDRVEAQQAAAQALVGAHSVTGRLPVTSGMWREGSGLVLDKVRVGYAMPETHGIQRSQFSPIEAIAQSGVDGMAYPGCQVVVVKDGDVIFQKNFGKHTYKNGKAVEDDDLYDLASITKVAASTLSLMYLVSEGKLDVHDKLGKHIPQIVKQTPYKDLQIKRMLSHNAGLVSWIPFYLKTLKNDSIKGTLYASSPGGDFNTQVAEDLYIIDTYKDTIFKRITSTRLNSSRKYKYSDLGYYFIKELVEAKTGMKYQDFVRETFYKPMGLRTMTYLPLQEFDKSRIVPTENDRAFRNQLIHGHVHDPGAAMIGGVGGHAGLFSNAVDLATLMQLFLNDGEYGGVRYLDSAVVSYFTQCHYCESNRRGLGFDKPVRSGDGGPSSNRVSLDSYGHSGFTGTLVWTDPKYDLTYVFLSNRVYPDAENRKLITSGIRTRIQDEIYKVLQETQEEPNLVAP